MVTALRNALPMTSAQLDAYRQHMDPLADSVIASIYSEGQIKAVQELLSTLTQNDGIPSDKFPDAIKAYLEQSAQMPAWADPALIKLGQEAFAAVGVEMILSLCFGTLPETYANAEAARLLGLTQNFPLHTVRRVYQTTWLVMDVAVPGGLAPTGRGIRSAQKVRLMHSVIRHLVLNGETHVPAGPEEQLGDQIHRLSWDSAKNGAPANQIDLMHTALGISAAVPRKLGPLGIKFTPEQRDGLVHVFNLMVYFMGAEEALLPANAAEADQLFDQMKALVAGPSPEGAAMTAALEKILYRFVPDMPTAHLLYVYMVRGLNDATTADMLGVPQAEPVNWAEKLGWGAVQLTERIKAFFNPEGVHSSEMVHVVSWVGKKLIQSIMRMPPDWNRSTYALPTEMLEKWDVSA